ncbi:unnamed protein product [Camellia sinensis]
MVYFSLAPKFSLPSSSNLLSHSATNPSTRSLASLCSSSMADTESYIKLQRLGSQSPPNPNKFYTHFMYKAVIVAIFLVVLPLLPSQAPEFINQTLHTRSWELVQLLLVGIAVSYGLFSRRNDETEKEHSSKFDNAHSYVSRFLQVSSVFDDETDSSSGSDDNKLQTWNSQYYRGEPVVVVAQESSVLEEQSGTASRVVDKPLLLPVRSLKSRVSSSDFDESINELSSKSGGSLSRTSSNLGSKRFSSNSSKSRNGEFGSSIAVDLEKIVDENDVLPSPIPWRSRSGRMEMREEIDGVPLYSLPPSMEDSEFNRLESRSFRAQSSRSSRPNSASPSPKNLSPSPSFSSESQAKNVQEMARKKIYYKSSPPPAPPPPPPPPPQYGRKPPLVKSNSSLSNSEVAKELKRSVWSVPKDLIVNDREEIQSRANSGAESRPRVLSDGSLMGKSVRTTRPSESISGSMRARGIGEDGLNGKLIHESTSFKAAFVDYEREEKREFGENVVVETDDDDDNDNDDVFESENYDGFGGGSEVEEVGSSSVGGGEGGPDVNKKADEFIAKFREQIRLQRIESIKRSTGQVVRNSLR